MDENRSMENNIVSVEQEQRRLKEVNNEEEASSDVPKQNESLEDTISKISKVMQRDNWGAQPPKYITMLNVPVEKIVLTWTETDQCTTEQECVQRVKNIQLNHMQEEGVPDIKHNFLLGGDGALYEGRGFSREGPNYSPSIDNEYGLTGQSIQVAFIDKCINKPTPTLLKVLSECLAFGVEGNFLKQKFTIYWMSAEDVVYIQPYMLKFNDSKK